MIDYYRIYKDGGFKGGFEETSPAFMALGFKSRREKYATTLEESDQLGGKQKQQKDIYPMGFYSNGNILPFGWIRKVFDAVNSKARANLLKDGLCLQSGFDNILQSVITSNPGQFNNPDKNDEIMSFFEKIGKIYSRTNARNGKKEFTSKLQKLLGRFGVKIPSKTLKKYGKKSKLYLFKEITRHMCKKKVNIPKFQYRVHRRYESEGNDKSKDDINKVIRALNQALEFGGKTQPVGVRYCTEVLYKPNFLGEGSNESVNISNLGSEVLADGKCHMHVSAIIGRRPHPKNKNECQYLIRDTYGNDCEPYLGKTDCKDGNLWVDESKLRNSLNSITYIIDK
jgi:hypothetical protein